MSQLLTRDAVLAANDITIEKCPVPEWGGHVFVKTMTARDKEKWEQDRLDERENNSADLGIVRASLAAATVCDEAGQLLFSTADIEALNNKSVRALDRVFAAAQKLNRISEKDVDELVKNSTDNPADDSLSD